jgi:fumarylacetoacetase
VTWVPVPAGSDFPVHNLPYGVAAGRVVVAVGDLVLDLDGLQRAGALGSVPPGTFRGRLDALLALGRPAWSAVRTELTALLTTTAARVTVEPHLSRAADAVLELAFTPGDYVDFYSSLEHATNLGRLFRPHADPLLPNWRHLPVGYHGRAGSLVVSGTPVRRPQGQRRGDDGPVFGPSTRLDLEAEVGFVVGRPSRLGEPVPARAAAEHVFGLVLVNDWSARDLQAWEYQPLGPFLGKSFATTVSPWVVPLDALAGARVPAPPQDPPPLPYLRYDGDWGLDLELEVLLNGSVISRPPYAGMYWTIPQQLAHATVNGAALRTGDLFASGTVSGPGQDQRGSLVELTEGGGQPLTLPDRSTRTFLEDGDEVTIRARTRRGPRLGFGECAGRITPFGA